jgi:hypothetical protein
MVCPPRISSWCRISRQWLRPARSTANAFERVFQQSLLGFCFRIGTLYLGYTCKVRRRVGPPQVGQIGLRAAVDSTEDPARCGPTADRSSFAATRRRKARVPRRRSHHIAATRLRRIHGDGAGLDRGRAASLAGLGGKVSGPRGSVYAAKPARTARAMASMMSSTRRLASG